MAREPKRKVAEIEREAAARRRFHADLQRATSEPQAGSIFHPGYIWPSGDRWKPETDHETHTTEPATAAG